MVRSWISSGRRAIPHADETFARILADGEESRIGALFARLDTNDATPPARSLPDGLSVLRDDRHASVLVST